MSCDMSYIVTYVVRFLDSMVQFAVSMVTVTKTPSTSVLGVPKFSPKITTLVSPSTGPDRGENWKKKRL